MMDESHCQTAPYQLGILVLPNPSWAQVGLVAEVCQVPAMTEQTWMQITCVHVDESPSLLRLPTSQALQVSDNFQTLMVIGGHGPSEDLPDTTLHWLRQQFRNASELILLGNVTESMAQAACLEGQTVACHWSQFGRLQTQYPSVDWSQQLFCQADKLLTCAGASAVLDVLIHWLHMKQQSELAVAVTEWLLIERGRDQDVQQRLPLQATLGNSQPKLREVVSLMENNLEEPLSTDELAQLVSISRRHLERLFKKHLSALPSRFYMQMRLDRARHLLRDTDLSIVEVSMSAGFSSASHFSTTYRSHFGITPRQERGRSTSVASANGLPNVVAMQARLD